MNIDMGESAVFLQSTLLSMKINIIESTENRGNDLYIPVCLDHDVTGGDFSLVIAKESKIFC